MDYTLIRSKRKTVGIYIHNGAVEVRAPLKYPKAAIDKFVVSKESWIIEKLTLSQKRMEQRQAFTLNYNTAILFRGDLYPLKAKAGTRAGFDGECFYFPPNLNSNQLKEVCVQMYRRLGKIHFTDRVELYAGQMGVAPAGVKVSGAKTRWGSCSSRRSINFSWRLIMADDDVIDYVVVHELAHLIQMNHSSKFWRIVENILPDYRKRRLRLRELQVKLRAEDW